jgi:hypothetical protein
MDTIASKFVAKWILPLYRGEKMVDMLCSASPGATYIKSLPLPKRPHSELWDDEKEVSLVDWKRAGYLLSASVAALAVLATQTQLLPAASMRRLLLNA